MNTFFSNDGLQGKHFCVVGDPIDHSLSPTIHQMFAEDKGGTLFYDKVKVRSGDLKAAVEEFIRLGGVGMNVTVPLKEEAYAMAHSRTQRASKAGAANVLSFKKDGEILADNTDGYGLVTDLVCNKRLVLKEKVILLLGAGGAARGVLGSLTEQCPSLLQLSNRTMSKVDVLCSLLPDTCAREVVSWGDEPVVQPDIVINATSLSLTGDIPLIQRSVIGAAIVAYDMMYSPIPTSFMKFASSQGTKLVSDGLGMLVEQAAESYKIWHGVLPKTDLVISRLRSGHKG